MHNVMIFLDDEDKDSIMLPTPEKLDLNKGDFVTVEAKEYRIVKKNYDVKNDVMKYTVTAKDGVPVYMREKFS